MPFSTEGSITTLTTASSSCKIHSHGATVLSFSTAGQEHLFVSELAKMDGSKAIRGGIPICFPIFGPTSISGSSMPQHGFARVNPWELKSMYDNEGSGAACAVYSLSLQDVTKGRGENNAWSEQQAPVDGTNCELIYEVSLFSSKLDCTLRITNTGTDAFDFQCLLHTYLRVDGHAATITSATHIHGLGGYAIDDKVTKDSGKVQSYDENVVLPDVEVDRVYQPPEQHTVLRAIATLGSGSRKIQVEAAGQVDEQVSPVSCVVWNPHIAKAASMNDFGDAEYQDMICIEPGLIGHQPVLNPGKEARLAMSLMVRES